MTLSEQEELELLTLERERAMGAAPAPRAPSAEPGAPTLAPMPSPDDWKNLPPLERQRVLEERWADARREYLKKYGTRPRGKPLAESISEFSGLPDPATTRDQAMVDNAAETGDVDYESTPGYGGLKTAAAIGGFTLGGGPAGATAAELGVRYLTLSQNLDKAVKAGAITEERASEILAKELVKGAGTDAAFNFGVPLLGHLAMKIPGAKWITEKAGAAVRRLMGSAPAAPKPTLRDTKVESRVALAGGDPAREEAVRELSQRTAATGHIPTPGQVRGEAGATETVVNKAFPAAFEAQEKALGEAADGMLRATTTPASQPSAKTLGTTIQEAADKAQAALKTRLRPAFEAADDLGVKVDMSEVKGLIKKALLVDSRVPGGKLAPAERAQLQSILDDLDKSPMISAEAALDFISRRKEQLRATTADWKPSQEYDKVIGALTTAADTAFARAAGAAGKGDVVRNLLNAQRDYKEMMGTVYDDAIKAALKKNPEDVGRFLWQGGNVSEIEQFHKMLTLAQREGSMKAKDAIELQRNVTRGFLQEAMPNIEAAAKWSQTLKENPAKRRTWDTLTSTAGGQELRNAVKVLEQAAQIATVRDTAGHKSFIPLGRAASGGLGVSYVTGVIHPGMAAVGLTIAGIMKAMSTAYVHGDKGAINLMAKVLRTSNAGTGAAAKALQGMLPELEQIAAKYDVQEMFVPAEEATE